MKYRKMLSVLSLLVVIGVSGLSTGFGVEPGIAYAKSSKSEADTEAVSETATEVVTEKATEAPTEAPTEKATEKITESATEPATEKATEKITESITEAQTEAPTEKITESITEAQTEAPTEKITEKITEKATEVQTEKPTEVPTEAQTEAPTEVVTEAQTEAPTESELEKVTESATESVTEAATEAQTEATEAPVVYVDSVDYTGDKFTVLATKQGAFEQGSSISLKDFNIKDKIKTCDSEKTDITNYVDYNEKFIRVYPIQVTYLDVSKNTQNIKDAKYKLTFTDAELLKDGVKLDIYNIKDNGDYEKLEKAGKENLTVNKKSDSYEVEFDDADGSFIVVFSDEALLRVVEVPSETSIDTEENVESSTEENIDEQDTTETELNTEDNTEDNTEENITEAATESITEVNTEDEEQVDTEEIRENITENIAESNTEETTENTTESITESITESETELESETQVDDTSNIQPTDETATDNQEFNYEDDEITVTVTVSSEANYPEDIELKCEKLSEDSEEYKNALDAVKDSLGESVSFTPYDVYFVSDGERIEPDENLVTINMGMKDDAQGVRFVKITDDGEVTYIGEDAENTEDVEQTESTEIID
jgi:outer membrane biosynthesis protein TonB